MPEANDIPIPNRDALREAIMNVLTLALQTQTDAQKLATERLKQLEVLDEYPIILCDVVVGSDDPTPEKHLAAVMLKNYLDDVFTCTRENKSLKDKGLGSILIVDLLEYMSNPQPELKEMVSYSIAILLALGLWEEITLQLNDMVAGDDIYQLSYAVAILNKAIDERFLKSPHYCVVNSHWFDVLLQVLKRLDIASETRAKTIRPMLMLMKYVNPNSAYVPQCLTRLTEELEKILNEQYSLASEFGLKCETIKCFNSFIEDFPEHSSIFVPPVLPVIGNLLTNCCEQYKRIIRGEGKPPRDSNEREEPMNFLKLCAYTLEFVAALIDMTYFDVLIEDFNNLIYCVFVFMACHDNMEKFLFHDVVEKNYEWALRDVCAQIVMYSLEKLESRQQNGRAMYFRTLHDVFQRLNGELDFERFSDLYKAYYMARISESMIYGLGLIKEKFMPDDPVYIFPLDVYINHWTRLLSQCNLMLQGRILWIGGVYCEYIPAAVMEAHFRWIMEHLTSENRFILIPCAESMGHYLKKFKKLARDKQFIIERVAKQIMHCFVSISKKTYKFPLHQTMNALGYLVKGVRNLAKQNIEVIEEVLIHTITHHFTDTSVMQEVNFVCAKIAQTQGFKILVHDRFLQFLTHMVHTMEPRRMKNDIDKGFDLLNTILIYSPEVDEYLILQSLIGAASRLNLNPERDMELDESAATVLTTIVVKYHTQLKFFRRTPKGCPALEGFPQLLESLIQPDICLPGNVLGKLVTMSIFFLSSLMDRHIENILRNVVTSSPRNDVKKLRSPWTIFIFLCMVRTTETIQYLSVIPGPTGGSALNYLMGLWHPEYFHHVDQTDRKILVLALVKVIQNCVANEADFEKMREVQVPCNRDIPRTSEMFSGMEYMYFLLIQCLLYQDRYEEWKPLLRGPFDFEDFAENFSRRKEEDAIVLYHRHPFHLNIIQYLVSFFNSPGPCEAFYLTVLKRFIGRIDMSKMTKLGCNIPEELMIEESDEDATSQEVSMNVQDVSTGESSCSGRMQMSLQDPGEASTSGIQMDPGESGTSGIRMVEDPGEPSTSGIHMVQDLREAGTSGECSALMNVHDTRDAGESSGHEAME